MRLAYWVCQLVGWTMIGLLSIVSLFQRLPMRRLYVEAIAESLIGIVLTHLLTRRERLRRWLGRPLGSIAARTLGTAFALAVVEVALLGLIEHSGYGDPDSLAVTVFAWLKWTPVFMVWIVLYLSGIAQLKLIRMADELRAAELRELKAQLNPHFLFNSLNSVRALVSLDPTAAREAVTRLARMLRYSLGLKDDLVTLARELETVDDYLALEALRLGERLTVERHIADEAQRVRIPVMLLLTLVENAIKHGIALLPAGGRLLLDVRVEPDGLFILVENPRPADGSMPDDDAGVGLANASERLRLLCGEDARLELDLSRKGRATARVYLRASA